MSTGTLDYIRTKYSLDLTRRSPIEIPNVGRKDLAQLFALLDFTKGVEIGVERGLYMTVLCESNPQAQIWGVDPWESYEGYRDYVDQALIDGFLEKAKSVEAKFSNCTLIKMTSARASEEFEDRSLDFVYIDANHELPYVIEDIHKWGRKVRLGGIISGHDFYKPANKEKPGHVKEALAIWTSCYSISPWFILGRRAKIPGEIRDWSRSWFWVKEK